MITQETVIEKIMAHLNHQVSEAELVHWAENTLVEGGFGPDDDVDLLMDIVMYLGAADSQYFPLTWDMCQDFLAQLSASGS